MRHARIYMFITFLERGILGERNEREMFCENLSRKLINDLFLMTLCIINFAQ
jgi:hypothetical protein